LSPKYSVKETINMPTPPPIPAQPFSAGAPVCDPFERPMAELSRCMDEGTLTAADLLAWHLARIDAFNRSGPAINAVSHLNPRAPDEAAGLDRERVQRGARGPLHGMPMLIKDNIDAAGLPTTAGCAALRNARPAADAPVVARLRAAGAIVLGKTNMSEFAASHGRFGYSSANGLTLNPYRLSRNASGSSSGTGAAVAAGFATFGLGTDSFGSVRGPACVHALVGLRPTHGRLDISGVLPLAPSFDTVGPLARSVDDAALVFAALTGDASVASPGQGLAGRRLGIVMDFQGANDEIDGLFAQACTDLGAAGALTVPVALPADALDLYERLLGDIMRSEWVEQLDRYLRRMPPPCPPDTAALLRQIEARHDADDAYPPNPLTIAALRHAFATRHMAPAADLAAARALGSTLDALMQSAGCDALIFPTLACPASPRFDREDPTYCCRAANPLAAMHIASATGFPEISVPMGWTVAGVPAGLSLLGRRGDDALLLDMARAYEAAAAHRRPPPYTPRLDWQADRKRG
jgi:amidase